MEAVSTSDLRGIEFDHIAGRQRLGAGHAEGPLAVGKRRHPADRRICDIFDSPRGLLPRREKCAGRTASNPEIEDRGR